MKKITNPLLKILAGEAKADFACLIEESNKLVVNDYYEDKFTLEQLYNEMNSNNIVDLNNLEKHLLENLGFNTTVNKISESPKISLLTLSSTDFDITIIEEYSRVLSDLFSSMNDTEKKVFDYYAENTDEILFTLDEFGSFESINKKGEAQLKYINGEIIEKHFLEVVSESNKLEVSNGFQKIIQKKIPVEFEIQLIPKVGFEEEYKVKLIPILEFDKITKLLGIASNQNALNSEKKKNEELKAKLTEATRLNTIERERAKQQISVLSELNNLKNDFISNVSHEFRTPLASIIGFAETIIDDKNLDIKVAKEFSEVILTESKRLAKLIDDILDFSELESKQQSLDKTGVNLINILNESADNFEEKCKEKNITLTRELPNSEVMIYADYERLSKVFNYLLSNALKFTNSNGRIKVMAQEFLKEVDIIISDTGIGIPEEKIPFLFDKFSKVKREGKNLPGAGFGLLTIKQIVSLHKGIIRVKSQVNKGTSFIIKLPKYSFN